MGKTLTILQDAAPLHTQPAETLVAASQFQIAEDEPQKPASKSIYNGTWKGVKIDPYRICAVYGITDPAIQHAIKKLLRLGRGTKDAQDDVEEAIQSLERWQEMQAEDAE